MNFPLTPTEQETWRKIYSLMRLLPAALDQNCRANDGVSEYEYDVMHNLATSERGRILLSDLAVMTSSSQSRLSHAMRRMTADGWVFREQAPHDARASSAVLTEAGQAKFAAVTSRHNAIVREWIFDQLTDGQVVALDDALSSILESLNGRTFSIDPSITESS